MFSLHPTYTEHIRDDVAGTFRVGSRNDCCDDHHRASGQPALGVSISQPVSNIAHSREHICTTMLRSHQQQRAALSDTFCELANLIAAVLVLGQFVREEPLSWALLATGAAAWIGFSTIGVLFARRRQ